MVWLLAVEVAFEVSEIVVVVAADGRVVVLGAAGVVPVGFVAVSEVGGQHEILAAVVVAAVDVGGQLVEVGGRCDLVRAFCGAATAPRPRALCGGEECEGSDESADVVYHNNINV